MKKGRRREEGKEDRKGDARVKEGKKNYP